MLLEVNKATVPIRHAFSCVHSTSKRHGKYTTGTATVHFFGARRHVVGILALAKLISGHPEQTRPSYFRRTCNHLSRCVLLRTLKKRYTVAVRVVYLSCVYARRLHTGARTGGWDQGGKCPYVIIKKMQRPYPTANSDANWDHSLKLISTLFLVIYIGFFSFSLWDQKNPKKIVFKSHRKILEFYEFILILYRRVTNS